MRRFKKFEFLAFPTDLLCILSRKNLRVAQAFFSQSGGACTQVDFPKTWVLAIFLSFDAKISLSFGIFIDFLLSFSYFIEFITE